MALWNKCKKCDKLVLEPHTCSRVFFVDKCPYCREHGAMNKVSKYGMWRCLMCHVGYDELTKRILEDSTEGFRSKNKLSEDEFDDLEEEAIKRKKKGIRITGKYKSRGKTKRRLP